MPVNLSAPVAAELAAIAGVRIGVTEAGVRKANRKDLTVFLLDEGAAVAGVFTQNRFCAAPVQVCREHLQAGKGIRAMVVNTGNANAGTGAAGLANARATCAALGQELGLASEQILPFSTRISAASSLPVRGSMTRPFLINIISSVSFYYFCSRFPIFVCPLLYLSISLSVCFFIFPLLIDRIPTFFQERSPASNRPDH